MQLATLAVCSGLLFVFALQDYHLVWKVHLKRDPTSKAVSDSMRPLATALGDGDIVLLYASGWDPSTAYYAGRKAITDTQNLSLDDPRFRNSLAKLARGEKVGAMIINDDVKTSPEFVAARLQFFHLNPLPIATRWGKAYVRVDAAKPSR
jgi:hypothetical protein